MNDGYTYQQILQQYWTLTAVRKRFCLDVLTFVVG